MRKYKIDWGALRNPVLPVDLILEVGVNILTEHYRKPSKELLQETSEYLKGDIVSLLGETLGPYPTFKVVIKCKITYLIELIKIYDRTRFKTFFSNRSTRTKTKLRIIWMHRLTFTKEC